MEKGPSVYAEYWTSEYNEAEHYKRHGMQMGYDKISDYSKAASEFVNNESESKLSHTAEDGTTYLYDPATNEFAMLSPGGKIITYFPPSRGIDYFYDQF